ncbi:5'-methylthioadenosine/adenosylhomocysteine nucleosidase [Neisseriaceae bacterium ESL0693]|nr:5'-methylthioadenosine/adenosylhomocysteine nucleosidase [Neisseriaceae bacterium ESL0693]
MQQNRIAIIAAMQPELDILVNQLQQRADSQIGSVCFYTGILNQQNVVITLSGIGKVNAAMTTAILIEHFKPVCVINTGSAGALTADLQIGDVVIGAETAHHDVDVTAFGYVPGQVPQLPARFKSDAQLLQAAVKAAATFEEAHIQQGLIVSGDQFIGSVTQHNQITALFADALAVEMEAAAIAQVCYQQAVSFVVIRAISDNGNDEASINFDEFLQLAGRHSAQMVMDLIKVLKI